MKEVFLIIFLIAGVDTTALLPRALLHVRNS